MFPLAPRGGRDVLLARMNPGMRLMETSSSSSLQDSAVVSSGRRFQVKVDNENPIYFQCLPGKLWDNGTNWKANRTIYSLSCGDMPAIPKGCAGWDRCSYGNAIGSECRALPKPGFFPSGVLKCLVDGQWSNDARCHEAFITLPCTSEPPRLSGCTGEFECDRGISLGSRCSLTPQRGHRHGFVECVRDGRWVGESCRENVCPRPPAVPACGVYVCDRVNCTLRLDKRNAGWGAIANGMLYCNARGLWVEEGVECMLGYDLQWIIPPAIFITTLVLLAIFVSLKKKTKPNVVDVDGRSAGVKPTNVDPSQPPNYEDVVNSSPPPYYDAETDHV